MTNDRETISGQVSGIESHLSQQETVQLTELLPVEQSRIKDNPDYMDQETATDGLRALRSFALGQHQDFVVQSEFDCFRKIERSSCEEATIELTTGLKKRATIGASIGDSRTNDARITTRSVTNNNERRRNEIFEQSIGRKNKRRKKEEKRKRKRKRSDNYSEKSDEMMYLAEKRMEERLDSVDVEDEVYYYRQQRSDKSPTASSNDEDEDEDDYEDEDADSPNTIMNLEILSAGVYRDMANNFSEGSSPAKESYDESLVKGTKNEEHERSKPRKRKSRKETTKDDERKKAEKDVGVKMDIMKKHNKILQGDNNNVLQRNQNVESDARASKCSKASSECTRRKRKSKRRMSSSGGSVDDKSKDAKTLEEEGVTRKKYGCLMCSSSFKGSGGLRNHYKVVHGAGPSYKCDECGKEFPLKERLKLHVRTHTGFKPYKCPDCHKSFARGGQLVQHRGTHSKIKPYRCSLCTGTFTCAANLALHVKRHNGQKDHKCQICGRGFVRKDALKKHLECLHRDVKSFLCVICNKTFKGHLPQHMRTHAQDRPHGCATCGQRFAQKSQLTVHQRTHSGQRPFRCLVCWQAFAHSTALKLHTRRHTGERPFKCAECNAGFTQLPHWKKHMKCIHGRNEPYSCKNCNSFFRIKNDLENHEKACHCDEQQQQQQKQRETNGARVSRNDNPDYSTSSLLDSSDASSFASSKFSSMSIERMRLLLAVLLKRISRPEKLDELGFGKRLIDEVLQDSLVSAGKIPSRIGELDELESLRKNLETFLEWTVPKEHWEKFRKINKSPEDILETLTAT